MKCLCSSSANTWNMLHKKILWIQELILYIPCSDKPRLQTSFKTWSTHSHHGMARCVKINGMACIQITRKLQTITREPATIFLSKIISSMNVRNYTYQNNSIGITMGQQFKENKTSTFHFMFKTYKHMQIGTTLHQYWNHIRKKIKIWHNHNKHSCKRLLAVIMRQMNTQMMTMK